MPDLRAERVDQAKVGSFYNFMSVAKPALCAWQATKSLPERVLLIIADFTAFFSVYQGLYNVWHRAVESELIPCLRHYGISLYCFNPLAGGFLTSRYQRDQKDHDSGERFDPNRWQGQLHRGRYW